ncbi:MATE family efflux transporter [Alphaproteobacteria bacterium KMM 3653]|uniref:MATE family efflux transporter n=1 Tax=Harenicola maris TaxID=2841044 RepID=A0AAP2CQS6_9RHOB|nr:MATE family efflux transporter [Harenicola maris]
MSAEQAGEAPNRAITHRRVLKVALPIILSNATVPILGAVDTGVVGQMGQAAPIGAVGIGATILMAVFWMFGFLRMGTVGLAAQANGAGNRAEVSAILSRALMIAAAAGAVLILVQIPIYLVAFAITPASPEVETLARDYMAIRIWSAPAAIAGYGLTGWLIALERTRGVLIIQLWMNALNIGLDLWFVLGFGWGVEGVAWATFIAEWSGMALGLWLCRDAFAGPAWRDWPRVFDPTRLRRLAEVSTDILLRSLMLQVVFVSFILISSMFGDVELAANQILMQFSFISAYALDGITYAVQGMVGEAYGRRDPARVRRAVVVSGRLALAFMVILAVVFATAGGPMIDVMTNAPEVRAAARGFLTYLVLAPLFGGASWMLDGVFIGATRTRDMRDMMFISVLIYGCTAAALVPGLENHGLWIAMLVSYVARAVTLGYRYPALERSAAKGAQ